MTAAQGWLLVTAWLAGWAALYLLAELADTRYRRL